MIVCTKCGFRNEDGASFCASCNSFLEWTGSRIGDSAAPAPVAEAPVAPPAEKQGIFDRVKDAVGLGGAAGAAAGGGYAGAPTATDAPGAPGGPGGPGADPWANIYPPAPSSEPTMVHGSRVFRAIDDEEVAPPAPQMPAPPPPAPPVPAAVPFAPPPAAPFAPPAWAAAAAPPPVVTAPVSAPPVAPPSAAPLPPAAAPTPPPVRPLPVPETTNPLFRPAKPAPGPARKPLVEAAPAPAIPMAPPAPPRPPAPVQPAAQPPAARPTAAAPKRPAGAPFVTGPAGAPAGPAAATQPPAVAPTDQPVSRIPTAQKPGPPERRTVVIAKATTDTPAPNPGDLVCANCGIGNDPARRFCRRCGQSLAEAAVAVEARRPWYRRIFRRSPKKALAAGERPKSMRTDKGAGSSRSGFGTFAFVLSKLIQVLVIVAIVGAAIGMVANPFGIREKITGFVQDVVAIVIPRVDPVNTSGTATGPAAKGHGAQFAFDLSQGYWAAPFDPAKPPTISGAFDPPVTINKVIFVNGAFGPAFATNARARSVTLDYLDAKGVTVLSKTYELKDAPEEQTFDAGAKGVVRVNMTVTTVYAAQAASAPVAVTEVEFKGSREGGAASPSPSPSASTSP